VEIISNILILDLKKIMVMKNGFILAKNLLNQDLQLMILNNLELKISM
jgi:hypothetical protein